MTLSIGALTPVTLPNSAHTPVAGTPVATTPAGVHPGATVGDTRRAQIHQVAQQFEGVLLRQLLSAAKMGGGEPGGYGSMAVDALADGVEQGGGLGLARQIEDALARASHNPPGSGSTG